MNRGEIGARNGFIARRDGLMWATCRFLSGRYATMIVRFKAAFARALPELPSQELSWRLHFVMGALSYTLAGTDALKLIAALAPGESTDDELLLRRLAPFLIAGLKAPLPDVTDLNDADVAEIP